jgi:hypothetical protein
MRCWPASPPELSQVQSEDDLSVRVEVTPWDESELCVTLAGLPSPGTWLVSSFLRALAAHQFHDLLHDFPAVAPPLVPVVDEQLPEKPGTVDL